MQAMPLEFDRDIGTSLVWNNGSRYQFKNVFVDQGTWPKVRTLRSHRAWIALIKII
jgi:hypothetical protein